MRNKRLWSLFTRQSLALAFVMLFSGYVYSAQQVLKVSVSDEGRFPFEFVDNGTPSGYLVEYLELVADNAGVEIEWDIVKDRSEQLEKARSGEHDVTFVDGAVGMDTFDKGLLLSLSTSQHSDLFAEQFKFHHLLFNSELDIELLTKLKTAITGLSLEEVKTLQSKWESNQKSDNAFDLTAREERWIEQDRRVVYSTPLKAAPFSFIDEQGDHAGIASDITKMFEDKYGIDAHFLTYNSWAEAYGDLLIGDIDFIPAVPISEERKKSLLFTKPYVIIEIAIFSRKGGVIYESLADMQGIRVGATKGSLIANRVEKDYPQVDMVYFNSIPEHVAALSAGKIDALLVNPYNLNYNAASLNVDSIVQSGTTEYIYEVAIAVHPSQPELVSLFNRILSNIDNDKLQMMADKWSIAPQKVRNSGLEHYLWPLSGALVVVLLILLFNTLKRKKTLKALESATHGLVSAQRVANVGSWEVTPDFSYKSLSNQACSILAVAKSKIITRDEYLALINAQDKEHYLKQWAKAKETGLLNVEYRLNIKSVEIWVNEIAELKFNQQGEIISGEGIIQDITQSKQYQQTLELRQAELKEMTSKLLSVQEEERKRVARELHDDLSQRLAVIAIEAGTLGMNVDDSSIKGGLANIKKGLVSVAEDTHALSRRLHPSILDDLGLVEALKSEIDRYQTREGISTNLFCTARSIEVSDEVALAIFRIVQEALRNVAKYSEASKVDVALNVLKDTLVLQISDDGMGFDVDSARRSPGLGLKSMMERAKLIGGNLTIHSEINQGTSIELQLLNFQENDEVN